MSKAKRFAPELIAGLAEDREETAGTVPEFPRFFGNRFFRSFDSIFEFYGIASIERKEMKNTKVCEKRPKLKFQTESSNLACFDKFSGCRVLQELNFTVFVKKICRELRKNSQTLLKNDELRASKFHIWRLCNYASRPLH